MMAFLMKRFVEPRQSSTIADETESVLGNRLDIVIGQAANLFCTDFTRIADTLAACTTLEQANIHPIGSTLAIIMLR
jgi:hypothetical protein